MKHLKFLCISKFACINVYKLEKERFLTALVKIQAITANTKCVINFF